jgi:hypothetical protein
MFDRISDSAITGISGRREHARTCRSARRHFVIGHRGIVDRVNPF